MCSFLLLLLRKNCLTHLSLLDSKEADTSKLPNPHIYCLEFHLNLSAPDPVHKCHKHLPDHLLVKNTLSKTLYLFDSPIINLELSELLNRPLRRKSSDPKLHGILKVLL